MARNAFPSSRLGRFVATAAAVVSCVGCAQRGMPDPRAAAQAYADAAARGDADVIWELLDEKAARALSREDVRRLVADQRAELAMQAKAIRSQGAKVSSEARVRFADGEDAVLELRNGRFYVASADALPAGARTPAQALDHLRRVLARRSYAGLLRVLTKQTRSAIENDLRALVEGLQKPEDLDVQQTGETATVRVPGGHLVRLRREAGTWRIDDID